MSKVAVVFHSGYGHTQRMAQAVAEGASAELVAIDAEGNLPEGGWYPEEKVTLEEAIYAYTMAPAIIAGKQAVQGSITANKWADLIVMNDDLFEMEETNSLVEAYTLSVKREREDVDRWFNKVVNEESNEEDNKE